MINKEEELSFITDENGKETPIRVLSEFENEDKSKKFVIYTDIEEKDIEDQEFFVAQIVTLEDGSQELADVDEADMEFCEQVFDEVLDQLFTESLEEESEEEEEEIVS